MQDRKGHIARVQMSASERKLRSELNKLIGSMAMVRGNLLFREKVCGKMGCKCARGEKHPAVYLNISQDGKYRQLFIPKSLVKDVQCWTEQYQTVKALLERLSRMYWDKLQKREV